MAVTMSTLDDLWSLGHVDRLALVEVEPLEGTGDLCLVPGERVGEVADTLAAVGGSLR
jgi:hypothetical protein